MNKLRTPLALMLALLLLLGALPLRAETVEEAPAETEQTEELAPEASPAPELPLPLATLPVTEKDKMPTPNEKVSKEAIVNSGEGAGFFELPSHGSAMLASLAAGDVLELMILGQSWCKVKQGEVEGYVPTKSLRFAFDAAETTLALVTAPLGKLTLRAEMTTKSKALATIRSGRAVQLLAKGEVFSLARYEGQEGYLLTAHLKEIPVGENLGNYTGVVSLDSKREANVRLRAEPKKNAQVYTTVKSGLYVVVLEIADGWAQVEYEGWHGYMMAEYLKRQD